MSEAFHELMDPLAGYALLCLRVIAVGWVWALDRRPSQREGAAFDFWDLLGRAVALGVLLNLLAALILAMFHAWTPFNDTLVWVVLVMIGGVRALRRGLIDRRVCAGAGLGVAGLWLAGALFVWMPPRSEWLAGGWDPGLYQNNAAVIERQHGIQDRTESIYAELTEDERRLFVESEGAYHEVFPGVPLRLEGGEMPLYFFHLTPLCGAWFLRWGGEELLFRLPTLLGIWCLFLIPALNGLLGMRGYKRLLGVLPWLIAPLWWYQMAVPTAEMLYIFLLLAAVLSYIPAVHRAARVPWFAALTLFASAINHLNAAVLLAVGLVLVAVVERNGGVKHVGSRMAVCFGALALGLVWCFFFADITIMRLHEKDHILWIIPPAIGVGFLAALFVTRIRWPLFLIRRAPSVLSALGVLAGVVFGVAALATGSEWSLTSAMRLGGEVPVLGPTWERLLRVSMFQGVGYGVWAALGLILLAWPRSSFRVEWKVVAFGAGALFFLFLASPGIAALYPWALRRFVIVLIPLCALAQAASLFFLFELRPAHWKAGRWAVMILLLFAVADGMRQSRSAAIVGDYQGMAAVMKSINEELDDRDVVVADDARWGTPLLLYFEREVINGSLLWQSGDEAYRERFLKALRRIHASPDRRIVWLTSLPKEMDVYPFYVGATTPLSEIRELEYPTVIHSHRGSHFATRNNERSFRLHVWTDP